MDVDWASRIERMGELNAEEANAVFMDTGERLQALRGPRLDAAMAVLLGQLEAPAPASRAWCALLVGCGL
ncbi:MAG: hypothetical protein AAF211_11695, partial [Myxococcota bacterium]